MEERAQVLKLEVLHSSSYTAHGGVGVGRRVGLRRGSMADTNALRSRGLFYASLIEDFERVITHYIHETDYASALDVLRRAPLAKLKDDVKEQVSPADHLGACIPTPAIHRPPESRPPAKETASGERNAIPAPNEPSTRSESATERCADASDPKTNADNQSVVAEAAK